MKNPQVQLERAEHYADEAAKTLERFTQGDEPDLDRDLFEGELTLALAYARLADVGLQVQEAAKR